MVEKMKRNEQRNLFIQRIADFIVDRCILDEEPADPAYQRFLKDRLFEKLETMWYRPMQRFIGRSEYFYAPGSGRLVLAREDMDSLPDRAPGINEAALADSANDFLRLLDHDAPYSLN